MYYVDPIASEQLTVLEAKYCKNERLSLVLAPAKAHL